MIELTNGQINAILNLEKHPLISEAGVRVKEGRPIIEITSAINAEWNGRYGAYLLLDSTLSEHFPDYSYRGIPDREFNPVDGTDGTYYFIEWQGETLIYLIMRSQPKSLEEWSGDEILRHDG